MSTAANTLDVHNGEGQNTRIHYVMSSGGRKLKEADIVIEGRISGEDIGTIREYLISNEGFQPDSVCVPDLVELMPLSWTPKGDERHDIVKISFTNSKPTAGSVDVDHFASGFQSFDYRAVLTM
jgi:hypothetical protein